MADFVQTMKDWRRMCKHYSYESMKDGQHSCAAMCPLGHITACGMIEDALDSDIEVMAEEVAKWAAEHPEPVYPSWLEWLTKQGIVFYKPVSETESRATIFAPLALKPIPADVAEKLGIEPKEGEHAHKTL